MKPFKLSLAEGSEAFLKTATYLGTISDSGQATVALTSQGAPRPVLITLVKEDCAWRFAV